MTTDDTLRDLRRLQRYTSGLNSLFAQAQAMSPRRSEATDGTGAVHVALGADGLPESIRMRSDWQQWLNPERFGEAVAEASAAAAGERMAAWTRALKEEDFRTKVDGLRDDLDKQPAVTEPGSAPRMPGEHVSSVEPRSLDAVTEDMIKAFDRIEEFTVPPDQAVAGTGSAASGRITLTVSKAGLVSCEADPRWVSRQSASALSNALGQALASARAELERACEAKATSPTGALDRLFGEALAILSDPRRLAGP